MNLRSAITVTGMLFNFLNVGELPHEKYHFYQNAGEGGGGSLRQFARNMFTLVDRIQE